MNDLTPLEATDEATETAPYDPLARNDGRPFWVQAQTDGSSPWFVAEDVCEALDVTTQQLKRMPAHCVQKIANSQGRKVWGVNAEGLLWLFAVAESMTRAPRLQTLDVDYLDSQGNPGDYFNTHTGVLVRGARMAMMAVMEVFPQKPRRRKLKALPDGHPGDKTSEISEGVSD